MANVDDINLPTLKWMGIRPSDIIKYSLKEGLQPLNKDDKMKVKHILKRSYFSFPRFAEWKRELEILNRINSKAEIQAFDVYNDKNTTFLLEYFIPQKIKFGDWI